GRADVFMLVRTIGLRANPGIVNPADDVVVISFLADATEVCGNVAADFLSSLSDGMARQAAEAVEHFLALGRIAAGLLFKRRTLEALLPDKRGDGLNFIGFETELRHFRGGIELPRVAEPVRNPIRIQLHPNFFLVR